jgi:undecaprenyl-diphosphatase
MSDLTDPTRPNLEGSHSTEPLSEAMVPGESELPPGDMPQSDEPGEMDVPGLQDAFSQQIGMVDSHSIHTDFPMGELAPPATLEGPAPTPSPPTSPVVGATVQATQAAVATARQATQQVTATIQQEAQKITVAPRKAIYRGKRFLLGYGTLVGAFGVLAILAKRHRHFPADVGVTHLLQRPNARLYDALMHAVSQLGWRWISVGTRASLSTLMWAAGFRMESAFTVSTWSGDMLTILIKTRVLRPRPTKDLVRVMGELEEASFPSGHVVHYVTFYGFLFYLVFTHLKERWFRTALLTLLAGVILLVGPSRIYMGHHWPSDVGGAYMVGTLWLGVIIIAYLETKANFTLHTYPPFFVKRPQQLG